MLNSTLSEVINISELPFKAIKNGVCVCKVLPSQTTSYLYISDGTLIVGAGSCTNGAQYSFSFIVEKEKTYKVSDGSNVQQYIIKYI